MAKLADALDLGSSGETRGGSTPLGRIHVYSSAKKAQHLYYQDYRFKLD